MLEFTHRADNLGLYLPKSVKIELSHEGGPIVVLVGGGNHRFGEPINVLDDEGLTVLRPAAHLFGTRGYEGVSLGTCHEHRKRMRTGTYLPYGGTGEDCFLAPISAVCLVALSQSRLPPSFDRASAEEPLTDPC